MPEYKKPDVKDILRKYGAKIEGKVGSTPVTTGGYTSAYASFKQEMAPELSKYEKWCKSLGNIIKLKVSFALTQIYFAYVLYYNYIPVLFAIANKTGVVKIKKSLVIIRPYLA